MAPKKKKRITPPPNRRATLTGEKTKAREAAEKKVDEQKRLRAQRAAADIEVSGGAAEYGDIEDFRKQQEFEGSIESIDPSSFYDSPEGSDLARSISLGEDVDVSSPDYLATQFSDVQASRAERELSDYAAADTSLGSFLPGANVNTRQPSVPKRRGRGMGDILKAESMGRAAETPLIKSGSMAEAVQTQKKRLAGAKGTDASDTEGTKPSEVIVQSADRPRGFGKPKPYSIGSVTKGSETQKAEQMRRLVAQVTTPGYIDKERQKSVSPGTSGPRPGARSLAEAKSWNPDIPKKDIGRITFPSAEEAEMSAAVVGGLGALFGQAPVSDTAKQQAVEETIKDVQRNAPLRTREGIRVTPNPDDPTESYILDPDTNEAALRQRVANRRGGRRKIRHIPQAKTARSGTSAEARAGRTIVNPAASSDVAPAVAGGTPMRTDILQQNLAEYRKSNPRMRSVSGSQFAGIMGVDEVTSEEIIREQREVPLGLNVYEERIEGRLGGARKGGTQPPDIELSPSATPKYDYPKMGQFRDPGRSMPTPTLAGIEDLRKRSPKAAAGLESGMYKGTVGAQTGTIKWERGEVPVWRGRSEVVSPGVTIESKPAPERPAAPEVAKVAKSRDQRLVQEKVSIKAKKAYESPAGQQRRDVMRGQQFTDTYTQAAAAFTNPPKAPYPVVMRGRIPYQYSETTGAMEEFKAPAASDVEARQKRAELQDFESRGGLAGQYERGLNRFNNPKK